MLHSLVNQAGVDGEIKHPVWRQGVVPLKFFTQSGKGLCFRKIAAVINQVGTKCLKGFIIDRKAAVLPKSRGNQLAEFFSFNIPPGKADNREIIRQRAFAEQRIERRHQLAARQVARGSEDDKGDRFFDSYI